jgi:hypothetical protein
MQAGAKLFEPLQAGMSPQLPLDSDGGAGGAAVRPPPRAMHGCVATDSGLYVFGGRAQSSSTAGSYLNGEAREPYS